MAAIRHHIFAVSELDPDVLIAEQAAGVNGSDRVGGNLIELLIDRQLDVGNVLARFQRDRLHLPHANTGNFHRRTSLQLADVGKLRIDKVTRALAAIGYRRCLGRKVRQRGETEHDKQTGADGIGFSLAHGEFLKKKRIVIAVTSRKRSAQNPARGSRWRMPPRYGWWHKRRLR